MEQQQAVQSQIQPVSQPINEQTKENSKSRNKLMIGCILIFFILISVIFGAIVGGKLLFDSDDTPQPQENGNGNGDEPPPDGNGDENGDEIEDKIIVITTPTKKEEVNGRILVQGQASRVFEELTIRLYDDDLNLLGQANAGLTTGQDVPIREWSTFLDITKSPTTLVGRIKIFPTGEKETSKYAKSVGVKFEQVVVPGRLQIYTPVRLQMMEGETVSFRGKMKNFYQNNMGVRLMTQQGKELLDDEIPAKGNTTDKFVTFEKIVDLKTGLDRYGKNGTWEFFEIDVEGDPGNVILSLTVRFD